MRSDSRTNRHRYRKRMAVRFGRRCGSFSQADKLRICERKRRTDFKRVYGNRHRHLATQPARYAFAVVLRYRQRFYIHCLVVGEKTCLIQSRRNYAVANGIGRKGFRRTACRPRRPSFYCRQKFGKLLRHSGNAQMERSASRILRLSAYGNERR